MTLLLGDFKSNEINVKVVDNSLEVCAEHEEKADEYGHIFRCIKRRYFLPRNVDFDNLKATLSDDGTLVVCAHKKAIEAVSVVNYFCELEKSKLDLCNRERNVKLKFKSFPQNPNLSLKFLRRSSKKGLLVVVREKVREKGRSRILAKKRKKPTFPSNLKLVPKIEKMDDLFRVQASAYFCNKHKFEFIFVLSCILPKF